MTTKTAKKKRSSNHQDESVMRVSALQIRQGSDRCLYSFAIDGKVLPKVASISRVHRNDEQAIQGYQRPEVLTHIAEIKKYVESSDAMIPNALVVAFDDRVVFEPATEASGAGSISGELLIPISEDPDESLPGWIVDGQQRAAAIRDAKVSTFPMFVTAFITNCQEEQRSQFILVNNTKPLPKGLIYELLPATGGQLPRSLERRRFPSQLLARLNYDTDSPLQGKILTPTNGDGTIKDNSILKMLENSLRDGALYKHWDARAAGGDVEAMLEVLKNFWTAVANTFPDAWDLPPRKSRLFHGVGIMSMGLLMDAISDRFRDKRCPTAEEFQGDLVEVSKVCRWCSGYWDFGPGAQRKWNELQNTNKDIQLLANYLLTIYKHQVWDRQRTV